ncbi:uncharacterized protein LOC112494039 isoform X1 [Cephus cinctus]|uniref:Uncharacterized protein LOC112494039 isoform X1 n=1 Tax=Cephus cinctus TaxID=211228 RepID=A0AAJ7RCY3_CEPCN|nr:uncharacterized protein LOC112494039 isoform X1 [Cephus cinctus]
METKCEVKTTVGIDLFKSKFQRLSNVYIVSLIDTLQLPELFIPWKLQEIDDPRNATLIDNWGINRAPSHRTTPFPYQHIKLPVKYLKRSLALFLGSFLRLFLSQGPRNNEPLIAKNGSKQERKYIDRKQTLKNTEVVKYLDRQMACCYYFKLEIRCYFQWMKNFKSNS